MCQSSAIVKHIKSSETIFVLLLNYQRNSSCHNPIEYDIVINRWFKQEIVVITSMTFFSLAV